MASNRSVARRKKESPIRVDVPTHIDYPGFDFTITHKDVKSNARVGTLKTPHGTIQTPNYIFCGTKGAIKNLSPFQVKEAGADIILGNTYHLMIQPGADLIQKMGGLHKFNGWQGPMMTDSGGFQVFSMGHGSCADEIKGRNKDKSDTKQSMLKISEEGVQFRSYKDGAKLHLTPESSIEIQKNIGADLIYQFDECTPYHVTKDYTENSMEMSARWGDRCLKKFDEIHDGSQALYGIVQGGVYEDLRSRSAQYIADRPFFGSAIGGCLGGSDEEMIGILDWAMPYLPEQRPVHFLGIGRIKDVFSFVRKGIDTFDCVTPTRIGRHGWALIKGNAEERINLRNAKFAEDDTPLDETMDLPCSNYYSKAYIHHLLKAGEMLAIQILTQHNIAVMTRLMREVRESIANGSLDELEKEWLPS